MSSYSGNNEKMISTHEIFNDLEDLDFLFCWTITDILRYDCFECGKRKTKDMYCAKCKHQLRAYYNS